MRLGERALTPTGKEDSHVEDHGKHAAFQALDLRLRSGKWQNLSASQMNVEATALGRTYNFLDINCTLVPTAPQFLTYQPLRFLRVYDALTH
jgi:hypothetical protein